MISKSLVFNWYLRLRLGAFFIQLFLILISKYFLNLTISPLKLLIIISIVPLTNLIYFFNSEKDLDYKIACLLIIDVIVLTFFLYSSGGYYNPLSFFYILQIILAGILCKNNFTWFITFLGSVSYLFLFKFYISVPELEHHHGTANLHLIGMFVGFLLLSIIVSYFIVKIVSQLENYKNKQKSIIHLASLNTLLASVTHELNTPLNTIYLTAQELKTDCNQEDLDLILNKIDLCKKIMDQLRLKSGIIQGENFKQVLLSELVKDLIINERVKVNLKNDSYAVMPVEAMIKIIRALIENSLTHSKENVEIEISKDSNLNIIITDFGIGMTQEQLSNLGQPFYTNSKGLGLGVYLAKSLIELLSGKIEYRSEINKGTTVYIRIPQND